MKEKLKFIGIFYFWILVGIPISLLCKYLNIDLSIKYNYSLLNFVCEVIIFCVCILLYRKTFKEDFKEIKGKKNFFKEVLKCYGGVLVVSISSSIVAYSIADTLGVKLNSSENNLVVQSILKSAPAFMFMGVVILGPIYEEGIMRLGLKKGIKNKGVFAIVSGFIFGIIHVVDNLLIILTLPILGFLLDYIFNLKDKRKYLLSTASIITYILLIFGCLFIFKYDFSNLCSINDLILSITYISTGIYFACVYNKYNNIFYSIGTHMIVNTLASLILFFT